MGDSVASQPSRQLLQGGNEHSREETRWKKFDSWNFEIWHQRRLCISPTRVQKIAEVLRQGDPKNISFVFETFSSLVDIYTPQTEDLKACIVGGMSDKTSGTLSPPDLDLNVEWHIKDSELLQLLQIHTLEDGASGQYQIQVQYFCLEKYFTSVFFRSSQAPRTDFWTCSTQL